MAYSPSWLMETVLATWTMFPTYREQPRRLVQSESGTVPLVDHLESRAVDLVAADEEDDRRAHDQALMKASLRGPAAHVTGYGLVIAGGTRLRTAVAAAPGAGQQTLPGVSTPVEGRPRL